MWCRGLPHKVVKKDGESNNMNEIKSRLELKVHSCESSAIKDNKKM